MTTDSFFALTCASMIALLFGFVVAFAGYRFFLILLPIWGFFFGFGFGAEAIQAIFGTGFLSDVTSWVVGFIVGMVFAGLAYLFYIAAIALLGGSLGYAIGVGIMGAIGFDLNFLTWLVGIVLGVIFAIAVLALNIQKWVVLIATSLIGAGVIVGTFLFLIGKLPTSDLVANPVKTVLNNSPGWFIVFLVIAVLGFMAQYQSTRNWEIASYNRWDEVYVTSSPPPAAAAAAATAPTTTTTDTTMTEPTQGAGT